MMHANPNAPLSEARFLRSDKVMQLLGYSDRSAFWQSVKRSGIPFVRINQRRCIFEESQIRAWLDRRTVGSRSQDRDGN